jgi:hypothetical protein
MLDVIKVIERFKIQNILFGNVNMTFLATQHIYTQWYNITCQHDTNLLLWLKDWNQIINAMYLLYIY